MRPSPIPREVGTCVSHDVAGGSGLATVVRSAGDGARVTRGDRACLGRVVDRARGVYRSKARGLFSCDPATGEFGPAPGGSRGRNARAAGTALAVSFGDAFLPVSLLRPGGLMACADACGHAEPDTVRALLASCVPAGLANRHAGDWWELTYARLPCPRARMASQRADECLADLGGEDAKRRLVGEYLALVGRRREAGAPTASPSTPRGRPTPAALPSRPPATTTARPARRSASPASRGATRACPSSSATSPAT